MSEQNVINKAEYTSIGWKKGILSLSPIVVFLLFYLLASFIVGDFYKIPLSVAFVIASVWAVIIARGEPLNRRIEIFSREAGQSNVIYMIWIFILAGAFASIAKNIGAVDATVDLTLRYLPNSFIVPGLFVAACFISLSIGTSVGTVVALAPLASDIAMQSDANVAMFVAIILGGAFFGDNLSFISDTTIAATRTQGCRMNEKFKANLWIALPAAIVTLAVYIIIGTHVNDYSPAGHTNYWLILPYGVIIAMAVAGVNVTVTLVCGILTALLIAICSGVGLLDIVAYAGAGINSMSELIIVTLLAAGMLGIIKHLGGIDYLLEVMTRSINGSRGAQGVIAILVGLVNICTANNTIAIITVGSLSKKISERFGVTPRKTASLLDTASCVVQCIIPYGAQSLLAATLTGISPSAMFRYLFYPWALVVMIIISIVIRRKSSR
jgi:Na+/H+ antiporter NhaC